MASAMCPGKRSGFLVSRRAGPASTLWAGRPSSTPSTSRGAQHALETKSARGSCWTKRTTRHHTSLHCSRSAWKYGNKSTVQPWITSFLGPGCNRRGRPRPVRADSLVKKDGHQPIASGPVSMSARIRAKTTCVFSWRRQPGSVPGQTDHCS